MDNYIIQALDEVTVTTNSKTSTYYNSDGTKVPRVTEIISKMIHSDGLMYWANSLGLKGLRYREVLNQAANAGTDAHSAIEKFLLEKIESPDNTPFLGFILWYNIVTQQIGLPIEIIYIEHKLACKWFGGTLDALMKIGNKIYLVDFKTSNHITYTYFLQLAAYRFMLKVVEGIDIDGVIVLQLDKDEPGFNEYLLEFSIQDHIEFMAHCEITFLSLVFAYHNITKAESWCKSIFKEMV